MKGAVYREKFWTPWPPNRIGLEVLPVAHVDLRMLAIPQRSRRARRRDILHVDRCLTCRNAAAAGGFSDNDIATLIAQTRPRTRALLTTSVLAALVGAVAVAAPLRGAALGFFGIFEPRTVAAVPLTLDDMRSLSRLPDFSAYATTRELRASSAANFSDARAATAAAGFALRQPTYVPDGIRAAQYTVNGSSAQLLTFANRNARARAGMPQASLPPDIVGSTLRIDLGATVMAAYETGASIAEAQRLNAAMRRLADSAPRPATILGHPAIAPAMGERPTIVYESAAVVGPGTRVKGIRTFSVSRQAFRSDFRVRQLGIGVMPLMVVQMPVPRIASTGVSLPRLAAFMLSQPGVPPRVAAAFAALGDLSTTLPIPIPIDKAYTQPVLVDGVQGIGIGDDTGIGAAVVWQKNGMLYGVFATRTAHDVLAIANSLR